MNKKKSQGAVEFLMILIFVLILISLIMYLIGLKSLDFQEQKNKKEIDNFAQTIFNEIKIMQKTIPGYNRKVEIPPHLMKRFNITLNANKSYFTLVDTSLGGNLSENIHYYEFGNNLNISLVNISGSYFLILNKNFVENKSGILII